MSPRTPTRLDRGLIEGTALALIDEHGLEALTMRALGERLQVDPTAVYRYYRNKDELLEALVDRLFSPDDTSEERAPALDELDGEWGQIARHACHGIRRRLLTHPALVPLAVLRPPRKGGTLTRIETLLGALRKAGFDDRETASAYHALLYYTLGHAALEAPYAQMDPETAGEVVAETRVFYLAQSPEHYPNTAAVAPHLYGDLDEQFDYGLERLIHGLYAQLSSGS